MTIKIILTGGPCSGKTTIINELSKLGYIVVKEAAREIILEEQEKENKLNRYKGIFPWTNPQEFQRKVFEKQLELEAKVSNEDFIFLDRSLIDLPAFHKEFGLNIPLEIHEAINEANYTLAIILDILPNYEKDLQRKNDLEQAKRIHESLINSYNEYNIPKVNLPVLPINKRVNRILSLIERRYN